MAFIKETATFAGPLGIWELSESSSQMIPLLHFSEIEKAAFEKISNEKRKKEFLGVRLLLKTLLHQKTEISYKDNGQPYLKNSRWNISISHSAELAVVLLSEKKTGIDVENTQRNISSLVPRFLNDAEKRQAEKEENPQQARILYWSAKEAIYKCAGAANIDFKRQIRIYPFAMASGAHFRGALLADQTTRNFILGHLFFQNNVIVYCVEKNKNEDS